MPSPILQPLPRYTGTDQAVKTWADQLCLSIELWARAVASGVINGDVRINGSLSITQAITAEDGTIFADLSVGALFANTVTATGALSAATGTFPGGVSTGVLFSTGAVTAGVGTGDQVGLQTHSHTQGNDSHGDSEAPTSSPTPGT